MVKIRTCFLKKQETTMSDNTYKLPDLPYDLNALEPVISAEIMQLHYSKHHAGYVNNLNTALQKYQEAEKKNDLAAMIALQKAIKFNGGGHVNHSIFWTNLAPQGKGGGEQPKGELATAIKEEFNSFENFIEKMSAQTNAIQGSGWGWLGYCKEKKGLRVATCANQDPLSTEGLVPLLGIDVWEHAYYLQYKNVRADYVKNIWKIVNWKNVEERFAKAKL
ncbi:MAG TPA: Fe-Mn family superoxide dismutase [Rhabdochlamydiaceae bacterium]|nr:Fe-Mn family superoxide dismutase [Rhabdochlamydiaceae bacterium]